MNIHHQIEVTAYQLHWAVTCLAVAGCGAPTARHNVPAAVSGTSGEARPLATAAPSGEEDAGLQSLPRSTETEPTESSPIPSEEAAVSAPPRATADEPKQAPSRYAPLLMRQGASCWIHDDTWPGVPVVMVLNVNSAAVYHGTCWAGFFDIASTASRPFHPGQMVMTTRRCVDSTDAAGQEQRFWAFAELVQRAYDIRVVQGKPRLLGAKGQRLATLRPPSEEEHATRCPQGFTE